MIMALSLILSITYDTPPDISARKFSDFSKAGMQAAADLWEDRYLPLHFEPFAFAKYGYKERLPATRSRKRKLAKRGKVKKGGAAALVHSGDLEGRMRRAGVLRVYPTRFVLIKPGGPYVTNRPRGNRPNMVREITTVVASEDRKMSEAYEAEVDRKMAAFRERRTVKTGST